MLFFKLIAAVMITSIAGGLLSLGAMLLTAAGRMEYVDYAAMTFFAWWLAFFCLWVFMVPATMATEPATGRERWLYFAISLVVAFGTTVLLDGATQPVSYILAVLVGIICGLIWTNLVIVLKIRKKSDV